MAHEAYRDNDGNIHMFSTELISDEELVNWYGHFLAANIRDAYECAVALDADEDAWDAWGWESTRDMEIDDPCGFLEHCRSEFVCVDTEDLCDMFRKHIETRVWETHRERYDDDLGYDVADHMTDVLARHDVPGSADGFAAMTMAELPAWLKDGVDDGLLRGMVQDMAGNAWKTI